MNQPKQRPTEVEASEDPESPLGDRGLDAKQPSALSAHRPRMLMASTRRPPRLSMPMIVCTHSYKIAFPALRVPSCPVATCTPRQGPFRQAPPGYVIMPSCTKHHCDAACTAHRHFNLCK